MTFVDQQITYQDDYASRIPAGPLVKDRPDPVIYGDGSGGPLSQDQIELFDHQGYLLLPDLFTEVIQTYRDELDRLLQSKDIKDQPEAILEPNGPAIRSIFDFQKFSSVFSALTVDYRLRGVAEQILGSDVYIHQSRINIKPAFAGKEFFWHSDFETWHVEDGMPKTRALSFSIWLDDNTEHNAPLMVIPGSHKKYVVCDGDTPQNNYTHSLRRQETGIPDPQIIRELTDEYGIESVKGKAGSVLVFDSNLLHGSCSNISPYPRANLFLVFNSVKNKLQEPYGGISPRPEYVAHRQ